MIQAIIKKGKVLGATVPEPETKEKEIKIKTFNSCILPATETGIIANSGKSLFRKAKEKPEKVMRVLNTIKNEGIKSAYSMVTNLLNLGSPVGYSLRGIITELSKNVNEFEIGDLIAVAGAGPAEYVIAPENLLCKLPKNLNFAAASTVATASIAPQSIRRANLTPGERCVVVGTEVIRLLTIQLLKTSCVRVAAIDPEEERLKLAEHYGSEITTNNTGETIEIINNLTAGHGADAVLFTASTQSNEPFSHSFRMCKKKGAFIPVGISGTNIKREDIYAKTGNVSVKELIDKYFEIQNITAAYEYLQTGNKKPLAKPEAGLKKIKDFYCPDTNTPKPLLTVGFNRRFCPLVSEINKQTDKRINPPIIHYRMNAGFLPEDHRVFKTGGRIIGKACYITDLTTYSACAKIKSISCERMTPANEKYSTQYNKTFMLKYSYDSIATIPYFAVGSRVHSKEYLEVYFDGRSIILDDYKSLKGYGLKIKGIKSNVPRKGNLEELEAPVNTLKSRGNFSIPLDELFRTTDDTFLIDRQC